MNATKKHLTQEQREEITKRVIKLVAQGYVTRGGKNKGNALDKACSEMGVDSIHWALFNGWLRGRCSQYRDAYKQALVLRKELTKLEQKKGKKK